MNSLGKIRKTYENIGNTYEKQRKTYEKNFGNLGTTQEELRKHLGTT